MLNTFAMRSVSSYYRSKLDCFQSFWSEPMWYEMSGATIYDAVPADPKPSFQTPKINKIKKKKKCEMREKKYRTECQNGRCKMDDDGGV